MTKDEALRMALEALEGIQRYGLDTLSGRSNGPDDRDWQRAGVNEMTKRARLGIFALRKALAEQPAPAITPEHLLALAQTASLELDKVIEAFKMAEQREVKDVVIDNMGDPFIAKAYVTPQPAQQEPVTSAAKQGEK